MRASAPEPTADPRRHLPSVDRVLGRLHGLPPALLADCARDAVDTARDRANAGATVTEDEVVADAQARADRRARQMLQRVVNATGVLVHTNLGRAPIDPESVAAAASVTTGYSNLEYELESGTRGSRHVHAGSLLARACGAEAGIVVNNNAAAVLLALGALARDRDVLVSRGELVEIGGGFRVPEIMAESHCRLIEVGTTNRTRRADYATACTDTTALVLKVHASNYRMVGFTEATPVHELATLGPPVMVDAGSGLLDEQTPWLGGRPEWLFDEPGVRQAVAAGAGIVTFSGDKLLGGPQAGVIVGRADLVAACAAHPLARAVRADKMTLAALQHVALAYLDGRAASLPIWRMAARTVAELRVRAEAVATAVPGATVVATDAVAGGGSLPGLTIPSVGVALPAGDADATLARLRASGVVARIEHDAVVCDLRTVDPDDDERLATALSAARS
jgi:L-seryl-tRNA(Ser) seleniumtransferase